MKSRELRYIEALELLNHTSPAVRQVALIVIEILKPRLAARHKPRKGRYDDNGDT